MSCGIGCRCSSDLVLLRLWCKPAATAPIGLLAWEPPYAESAALKSKKKNKKQKKKPIMEENMKKNICITEPFCFTAEINTTL